MTRLIHTGETVPRLYRHMGLYGKLYCPYCGSALCTTDMRCYGCGGEFKKEGHECCTPR